MDSQPLSIASTSARDADARVIGTVARVAHILRVLADETGSMTLTFLAEELNLPVSTTHRLMRLLMDEGFVELVPETRQYRPGPDLLRIASSLAVSSDIAKLALPLLEEVTARTGETAQLGVYLERERKMAFAARVDSPHALRFSIPSNVPQSLVWGSSGRVILAWLDPELARSILASESVAPASGDRPPTWSALSSRLDLVRERGWDLTHGEKLADAVGISAPVFGRLGVEGSISLPVPSTRFNDGIAERLIESVVDAARQLTHLLGGDLHDAHARSI